MERSMEAIVACCAGLDVHQAGVVACLNRGGKEIRSFGTTRGELAEICAWLRAGGCTLVAMESTGVYWHPVYFALEGQFELIVGNAQHIKNVPGRKTDVKDCDWISDLARHGLIAKSFVPPKPIRELRELTRYRRKLVQVQAAERNRLIKLLESADIKLAGLISGVVGVSGRAILHALIEGEETPKEMAQHARGRMRPKIKALARALDGRLEEHHRFLMRLQFARIEAAECDLERLGERLSEKLAPYAEPLHRLMRIPGVDWIIAATIIAEIGIDMSAFGSAARLASWTAICPGNHQSGGKQRRGKIRKGNVHLKAPLVTAALAPATRPRPHRGGQAARRLSGGEEPPSARPPRRDACACRHRPQDPDRRLSCPGRG